MGLRQIRPEDPGAYASKFLCNSRSSYIPTGLRPPAQGWLAAGLPWELNQSESNRNAVPPKADPGCNPRWGWILFFADSQGSSFLATLGCRAQRLWRSCLAERALREDLHFPMIILDAQARAGRPPRVASALNSGPIETWR